MDAQMDVKTVYPLQTKFAGGIKSYDGRTNRMKDLSFFKAGL